MSSRAIFLSAGGDVLLSALVLRLWKRDWYDEVDRMYICFNNHAGAPLSAVREFLGGIVGEPRVHLIYHPQGIGNGAPITEMTKIAQEELVMLLEDDGFIFTPGVVNECFQRIEKDQVDAVGSPRFSCGPEIAEASKVKYGLDYSGFGDVGPHFWPNMFFVKRADLLRTDLDFASHTFLPGQYSPELNWTFKEINHGDTFVWACIQLRALGLRFSFIPQYHADPYELENRDKLEMNWKDGTPPYIHGGSLSAGWGGYLSGRLPDVSAEISRKEIETRVAFWTIACDVASGFEEFKKNYKAGIEKLIEGAKLDREQIKRKVNLYRGIMKL